MREVYFEELAPELELDGGAQLVLEGGRGAHELEQTDGVALLLLERCQQLLALPDGVVVRLGNEGEGLVQLDLHSYYPIENYNSPHLYYSVIMHFNHPDRTLLPPSTRCRNLSII